MQVWLSVLKKVGLCPDIYYFFNKYLLSPCMEWECPAPTPLITACTPSTPHLHTHAPCGLSLLVRSPRSRYCYYPHLADGHSEVKWLATHHAAVRTDWEFEARQGGCRKP